MRSEVLLTFHPFQFSFGNASSGHSRLGLYPAKSLCAQKKLFDLNINFDFTIDWVELVCVHQVPLAILPLHGSYPDLQSLLSEYSPDRKQL